MILADGDTIHAASPEPVVRAAVARREPRRRRGRTIDLSGTLAEATRRVASARSRSAKIEQALQRGRRQQGPRRGAAADQLQDAAREAEGVRHRTDARDARLEPGLQSEPAQRRRRFPPRVTSSRSHVADGRRQHEVQPSGDDLLVAAASRRAPRATERSATGGSGPSCAMSAGQRVAVARRPAPRVRRRGPRRPACRSRPPRRGGSGGTCVTASSAWPAVWPKFRMRRRPVSRSSCSTTAALIAARLGDDRHQRVGGRARRSA